MAPARMSSRCGWWFQCCATFSDRTTSNFGLNLVFDKIPAMAVRLLQSSLPHCSTRRVGAFPIAIAGCIVLTVTVIKMSLSRLFGSVNECYSASSEKGHDCSCMSACLRVGMQVVSKWRGSSRNRIHAMRCCC